MKRNVLTVRDNASVIEVARFLRDNGINGAPVMDDVGKVIGIVSQSDMIKLTKISATAYRDQERETGKYDGTTPSKPPGLLQTFLSPLYMARWGAQAARLDRDEEESDLLRTKTAADIMTKPVITAGQHDSIRKVVETMTGRGINRVPVVDERGELVGMITRADIVEAMAKQLAVK